MMNSATSSDNLALVEEFFFVLSAESETSDPIFITAQVDLTEFALTEDELQKLKRLAQKLELALLADFNQQFPAASVVVEIRNSAQQR